MKDSFSRREFLSSLGIAALSLSGCASGARLFTGTCAPGASGGADVGLIHSPVPGKVVILDSLTRRFDAFTVGNLKPHSLLARPDDPRLALVIDQDDTLVTLVDLVNKQVLREIHSSPGFTFTGHGAFTADGARLYLPEYSRDPAVDGKVSLHDGRSLEKVRELSPYGHRAHNVMLLKRDQVLVVGLEGVEGSTPGVPRVGGCLTFIDVNTGALLEKVIPAEVYLFMSHFDVDADESIVVSTQSFYVKAGGASAHPWQLVNLHTPLMFGGMGQKKWFYELPGKIAQRMLHNHTVVVDRARHRAVVAHPLGGLASIWDMKTRTVLQTLDLGKDAPLGLAIDSTNRFYVIGTRAGFFHMMDAGTLQVVGRIDGGAACVVNGSAATHISSLPRLA